MEKKLGIPRRLVIPAATDALVLQTLIDVLEKQIKTKQPTGNAYYSRSHALPPIADFDGVFGYPWWILWPQFQAEIWKFARSSNYTVVTDISNYFDTISLDRLRKSIAAASTFKEPVLDFLFLLLEAFVWRPDYIPFSGIGLPQINFDAPRLLAHAFLFTADRFLEKEAAGRYVRWMDDMDFGVDSNEDGRRILRDLDQLLAALGVRLNTAKTVILDQVEAIAYFWINTNIVLNVLSNSVKNGAQTPSSTQRICTRAISEFLTFSSSAKQGQWEKVYKRFFTLFGHLRSDYLVPNVPSALRDQPELRDSICRYYEKLGFSTIRLQQILDFMSSGYCCDDCSWFTCCKLLTEWEVPLGPSVQEIVAVIQKGMQQAATPARFTGALWVLAKYGDEKTLGSFILRRRTSWNYSIWAARQAFSCYGMLSSHHRQRLRAIAISEGLSESLTVLTSLSELEKLDKLDSQLKPYLLKVNTTYPYPLPKFLIGLTILRYGAGKQTRLWLKDELLKVLKDPIYTTRVQSVTI